MAQKSTKKKKQAPRKQQTRTYTADERAASCICGAVLIALGALLALATWFGMPGTVFAALGRVARGLCGSLALVLPAVPVWGGVLIFMSTKRKPPAKPFWFGCLLLLLLCTAAMLLTQKVAGQSYLDYYSSQRYDFSRLMLEAYKTGATHGLGGGFLGMPIAYLLWSVLGAVGGAIVAILLCALVFLVMLRLDWRDILDKMKARKEVRAQEIAREEERRRMEALAWQQQQAYLHAEQERIAEQERFAREQQYQAYVRQEEQRRQQEEQRRQAVVYQQPVAPQQIPVRPTYQPNLYEPLEEEQPVSEVDMQPPVKKGRKRFAWVGGEKKAEAAPVQPEEETPPQGNMFRRNAPAPEPPVTVEDADFTEEPEDYVPQTPARTVPPRPVAKANPMSAPSFEEEPEEDLPNLTDDDKREASLNSFQARLRKAREQENDPQEEVPATHGLVMPVVTMKAPEGGYEPELKLKARRDGKNPPPPPEPEKPRYVFPSIDLLPKPKAAVEYDPAEDARRTRILEKTLQSFKIAAKVRHITHGPTVSRYELELAEGINVNKITGLNRNIAMSMEAETVRIEAPIPGKNLVGVEVPNKEQQIVTLREILQSPEMANARGKLVVALGRDIGGDPVLCDLAKMPHLLIAGTTGSGKSVCINTILNSLVFRCTPEDVRMILIDPKEVELKNYNVLPHLLIPVVSTPEKAAGALAWAMGEMNDRYRRISDAGVRDIDGYNENRPADAEPMPRIVVVVDELADLMLSQKKRDIEDRIASLAAKARAAGIHLIVATQRPSVDIITGVIKNNIPSRIAFKVAQNVDSRTILDHQGAEQLLGKGDMLYKPTGKFATTRVQGCFLSDREVNRITDFVAETSGVEYDETVLDALEELSGEEDVVVAMPTGDENPNSDDSLILQCAEMAVNEGQLSTSTIQRRLRLGYSRAGRLMDQLEELGIVSAKDGSKPRECLISREALDAMKATGTLDK